MFGRRTPHCSNTEPVSGVKRGVQGRALFLGKAYLLAVQSYLESCQLPPPAPATLRSRHSQLLPGLEVFMALLPSLNFLWPEKS